MKLQIDDLGFVSINVEDWDINHSFPRLTLTTDYSTWITYISRKAVPAGTPITDIKYWKPIGRLSKDLVIDYQNFKNKVNSQVQALANIIGEFQTRLDDMDTQMQSFFKTASGGEAFSDLYGDSQVMGVTQKTLTNSIMGLYQLITDITGIDMNNVEIVITPDAFLKPESSVNISAIAEYGILESIKVYFNNTLVVDEKCVKTFSRNFTITEETDIRVEVVLLGRTYTKNKTIRMSSDFFIGAGYSYEDIYIPECSRPYDGDPKGTYIINAEQGQRIIIIMPTEDVPKITTPDGPQIEMNDINIPMIISTFGIYTVFTSLNCYQAGEYQIDINY